MKQRLADLCSGISGVALRRDESPEFSFTCCSVPRARRTPRPETFQPGLERACQTEAQIGEAKFFFSLFFSVYYNGI